MADRVTLVRTDAPSGVAEHADAAIAGPDDQLVELEATAVLTG